MISSMNITFLLDIRKFSSTCISSFFLLKLSFVAIKVMQNNHLRKNFYVSFADLTESSEKMGSYLIDVVMEIVK